MGDGLYQKQLALHGAQDVQFTLIPSNRAGRVQQYPHVMAGCSIVWIGCGAVF